MDALESKRNLAIGGGFAVVLAVLAVGQFMLDRVDARDDLVEAPVFEVDPLWPKPMPNNWLLGMAIGVAVDDRDHVWIIHRGNDPGQLAPTELARRTPDGPVVGECCQSAPPVLAFDQAGNLVASWGGPGEGYDWPQSNHGIVVDHKGNVWIGGNGADDAHVVKFTRDGKFLAQFGKAGARRGPNYKEGAPNNAPGQFVPNSHDMENFGRVAKIFIDPRENEAYLADGYFNKRVAVIDMDSGKIKRYWGAYGNPPDDTPMPRYNPQDPPAQQFRTPVHCAEMSNDGFVYVCDRPNDRIQVFTREGKFVRELFVYPETLADGSVWDIAFSKDPEQQYLYVADGVNERIYVVDRKEMKILTHFGYGGRQPGMFLGVHSIATDSQGNIYTTETYTGKRLQRFVYKGMGKVPYAQGVVWPARPTN